MFLLSEFIENEPVVVTQQPRPASQPTQRRNLPVYTVGWDSIPSPQFLPMTGLDFLMGVSELVLQQTVENCRYQNLFT